MKEGFSLKRILITGTFRSGTSLLTACLNVHHSIFIAWQPFWPFFKACIAKVNEKILSLPQDQDYPMGVFEYTGLEQRDIVKTLFSSLYFSEEELSLVVARIKKELSRVELEINVDLKNYAFVDYLDGIQPGLAGDILSQLFDRLPLYYDLQNQAEKSPCGQLMTAGIKEIFCEEFCEPFIHFFHPNAFAIHIIRDPRAVLASRNYGRFAEATGSRYPIFFIIRSWKRTVLNYNLNRFNKKYLMVKYEDFVRNTSHILQQICRVLDLKFSDDMLDFRKFRDSRGNQWKQNSSFDNTDTITTGSINKWKDILTADEIETLEYYCQPEMRMMGYMVKTEHFNEEKIKNFKEDQSQIRGWLKKFDFGFSWNHEMYASANNYKKKI